MRVLGCLLLRLTGLSVMQSKYLFNFRDGMNNPWWVTVNTTIGQISFEWILIPIFYYMNIFNQPVLKSQYKYPDGQDFGI
jgi:hypothetical protein